MDCTTIPLHCFWEWGSDKQLSSQLLYFYLLSTFELFCCFLTFCSLSYNQISDEGACEFARALQVNQSLQELK